MLGCVRPQPKVRVSMLTKDCQSAHKEAHLYRQLERKCKGSRIQTYFIDEIIYDNGLDRSGGRACYLILRHLAVKLGSEQALAPVRRLGTNLL